MGIIVRRMREEDIPQAVEIEKSAFSRPWSRSVFKATLLLPYAAYYVAVEEDDGTSERIGEEEGTGAGKSASVGGRVVGLCGVKKIFEEGDISNVAVHSDYRGRGICRRMLEQLLSDARMDGVEAFTLEVRASNQPALHLYESLGFRTEGIRPGFYDHPEEDGLIMWLR